MKQNSKYLFVGGLSVLALVVLLLVFMINAPFLTVGTPVELPKIEVNSESFKQESITIVLNGDGAIFIQNEEIPVDDLVEHFITIYGSDYQQRIYLRGNRDANYGDVMRVMARMNAAGFTNIGLVTEPDQNK